MAVIPGAALMVATVRWLVLFGARFKPVIWTLLSLAALEVVVGLPPPPATSTVIPPPLLITRFQPTVRQHLTSPPPTHALPPRHQVATTAAAPLPPGTDLPPMVRAVLHPPLHPSGTTMAVIRLMRVAAASLRSRHTEDLLGHHTAVLPNPAMVLSLLTPLNLPTALTPLNLLTALTPPSHLTVPSLPMAGPLTAPTALDVPPLLLVPLATAADTLATPLVPLPATVATAVVHQVVLLPTPMAVQ